ncbi:glycosyl transferase family 1 [Pseudoalteromonas phenolica]|uniref:Glycosyl transferase family 1 n=1 Tax=Pseudoalteromonas phenolica TaxID=161398 RepID=A0A5R9Q6U8_9GAMM|nr:glycosyltransferase family 4 protein [Pseudoalteromonas phenolica]TLX48534.1 glycosyl transferase family 1 [Pseudoalteromonas phenolica]
MKSVKTILFLDSSLYGGIETHIVQLVRLLKSHNLVVEVLFYQDHGNTQLYRNLDDAQCTYTFLEGKVSSLYTLLKNKKAPVNLHTHGYKAGIIGRLTCKLLTSRCISTYHAGEAGTGFVYLYNYIDKLTSFMSKNFVVSDRLLSQVHNAEVLDNFVDITNPMSFDFCDKLRVGFVGRLSHEKGPDNFVELARRLDKNPSISFNVFGDGPMAPDLQSSKPANIKFHGHQASSDFWDQIDVLVISSRAEGLPMVLLEAMARSKCVISFDVGAVAKVISHNTNGYICTSNCIDELSETLISWSQASKDKKKQITHNAFQTIQQDFSGSKQLEQLTRAYFG